MKKLVLCSLFVAACGGDDGGSNAGSLFEPKPECTGAAVETYAGTFPQVISTLAIGSVEDGFDLNKDGKPDNKLAAVSSLAQSSIDDSFKNYDILIPIEYFDFATVAADECVKFSIYLAKYVTDTDADGKKAYVEKGDCNDHDATIRPGMPELPGNFKDDDCDRLADEDAQNVASTDPMDRDGDGVSVMAGDCDDTNAMVKPGLAEMCTDGFDNDCDGVADRSVDAMGTPTACSPYDRTSVAASPGSPAMAKRGFSCNTRIVRYSATATPPKMALVSIRT